MGTGKPLRDCNDCVADAAEFLEEGACGPPSRGRRLAVIAAMDKEVNLLRGLLGTDAAGSVAGRVKIITGRLGDAGI